MCTRPSCTQYLPLRDQQAIPRHVADQLHGRNPDDLATYRTIIAATEDLCTASAEAVHNGRSNACCKRCATVAADILRRQAQLQLI